MCMPILQLLLDSWSQADWLPVFQGGLQLFATHHGRLLRTKAITPKYRMCCALAPDPTLNACIPGFSPGNSRAVRVVLCRFNNTDGECPVYPPPPPSPPPPPPLPPSPLPPQPPPPPSPPPPPVQVKLTGKLAYMPGLFYPNKPSLFRAGGSEYFVLVLPSTSTALWPYGSTYAPIRYLRLKRSSFLAAINATTVDAAMPLLQSKLSLQCELDPSSRMCERMWEVQVLEQGPGRQALLTSQPVALYHVHQCGAEAATLFFANTQV